MHHTIEPYPVIMAWVHLFIFEVVIHSLFTLGKRLRITVAECLTNLTGVLLVMEGRSKGRVQQSGRKSSANSRGVLYGITEPTLKCA
jgi:hypothetical protein